MADEKCQKCGGSGWIVVERDGLSGVSPCDCGALDGDPPTEDSARIPAAFRNKSFDNFQIRSENPVAQKELQRVFLEVHAYAREFPATTPPGLLLIGGTGVGKTHLAIAALQALLRKGFDAVFFDYQELLELILRSYDPASGAANREVFELAMEADVLLLDDLGARRTRDWVEDAVNNIISHRYNHGKPLIATSNLPDTVTGDVLVERDPMNPTVTVHKASLQERIGKRAHSRLFEMCRIIKVRGVGDFRIERARV
jgi:DNA replication protein DnaC